MTGEPRKASTVGATLTPSRGGPASGSRLSPPPAFSIDHWARVARAFPDCCAHEWIAKIAASAPDSVAITDDVGSMTYHELDAAANRLAWHLKSLGVVRGSLVAICL